MKKFGLILLGVLVCASLAVSQADLSLFVETVDVTGFPEIMITFSAWHESGLPLTDLTAEDLTLQENDGPAFHPDQVLVDEDAPLAVALVMDVSGSMQGQPLEDAKVAAARFLDRLSPGDQAALIAFSHGVDPDPAVLDPEKELDFTSNLSQIYDSIEALTAEGGTELYNAVAKAVTMTADVPSGHKAILVLSDGVNDPADVGDGDAAITLARENDVPVYVIGLGNQIDEPYLRRLATETGAFFRLTPRSSELAESFDDMAALLKTQFTLAYTSTITEGADQVNLKIGLSAMGSDVMVTSPLGAVPALATPTPTAEPENLEPTEDQPTEVAVETKDDAGGDSENIPVVGKEDEQADEEPAQALGWVKDLPLWVWIVVGLVVIFFFLLIIIKALKKSDDVDEKCASCGYVFKKEDQGTSCPQCGATRRLDRMKDFEADH